MKTENVLDIMCMPEQILHSIKSTKQARKKELKTKTNKFSSWKSRVEKEISMKQVIFCSEGNMREG